ncbi:DHA1 family multidrug resistance protein-like MFS transporter [Haloactinopolyspora alba]|uniref:DHA1 family multidrug resistance protein-like MFS transporter n=1 Tax=Haloactinopolyspora alba TaxID=648780 RepID=A0A2P8E101_9ACTN|nr:MFS transporter [Haloactinopolyspora alba]PSL03150.1 DHA1 family multidrug resistance protein-like MFS transporter [Haloactinopolyspora alba]
MAEWPWARIRGIPGALWVLYADTFTMALGFFMLIPLLAYHLLENLALSVAVVGALSAVRTAAQQGLMPWSGWIADRMDYRRAIAVGVLIRAAGFTLLGAADSVPALAVACVLTGAGGSLFHPASYAAYAALARGRDHVTVYSTRETLSNLGFVLGPVVGGLLSALEFRWVCYGAATLFGMSFVITLAGLPSGLSGAGSNRRVRLRAVVAHRAFVRYCLLAAGIWLLISQLYLAVPVRAASVLPDAVGVGVVYSSAAVVMVVLMVPLTGLARRRWPTGRILATGAAGLGGGLAVMGVWDSAAGLFAGVAVFTVGQILSQPVMNAVVADYARENGVASYFGVHGLALAVGGVAGNVGGGFLYGLTGGWSLLSWAVFASWAVVLIWLLRRPGLVP